MYDSLLVKTRYPRTYYNYRLHQNNMQMDNVPIL
jgi:hypothetical protein